MNYAQQQLLNKEHIENPQIGDFWHEMFSPYFVVAEITNNGVIVYDKTLPDGPNHYVFDETKQKIMNKEEMRNKVTYSTMRDSFVADVRPCKKDE